MIRSRTAWVLTIALSLGSITTFGQPTSGFLDIVANCGADPTGTVDSAPAIQECLNSASDRIVFIPPGRFRVDTGLVYAPPQAGILGPSLILRGAGRYSSVLDSRVSGEYLLTIRPNQPGQQFQVGGELSDFGIITTAAPLPPDSHGIYIRGVWQMYLRSVRVEGLTGDGVMVESLLGDPDGPVNVTVENSFFWNNLGYGVRFTNSPGHANVSFVSIRDSSIQGNAQGGIFWNGQQLHMHNTGVARNSGTGGLIIKHNGANSQLVNVIGCTFENNSPRLLDIETLLNGYFVGNKFTSNLPDIFPSENAIRVGGGPQGSIVRTVTFVNTTANVSPAHNPHTFFDIAPSASRTAISQTRWQRYDAEGQRRFKDDTSDSVISLAAGANDNVVVEEHAAVRVAAPGNFALGGFEDGYNGRILRLLNASGRLMTLLHESAGSRPENRIRLKGGVPVTVAHLGTASLIYDSANKRWWLLATQ